jgi:hypothetical protein
VSNARIDRTGGQSGPPGFNRHTRLTPTEVPLRVPPIEDVLVAYLNHRFPDRLSLVASEGSLDAARGARAVVDHLIELHRQQNTKDT